MDVARHLENDLKKIEERMQSPAFIETLIYTIERTARTTNEAKLKRFGTILGYNLGQGGTADNWDDVNSFIRTVDEISEADIKVLKAYDNILPYISTPNKRGLFMYGVDKDRLTRQNEDARRSYG